MKKSIIALAVSSVLLAACGEQTTTSPAPASSEVPAPSSTTTVASESERANQLFDQIFDAGVDRSPIWQTYLGLKKDYDKWNDISEQNAEKELAIAKQDLAKVKQLDTSKLDPQTLVSYHLLVQRLENQISDHQWRHHSYPVNQMRGLHAQIPALLINQHRVTELSDAQAYVSRLNGINPVI